MRIKEFERVDKAEIVPVIRIKGCRGKGTSDDPFRIVEEYWTFEGQLIADMDHALAEEICDASS